MVWKKLYYFFAIETKDSEDGMLMTNERGIITMVNHAMTSEWNFCYSSHFLSSFFVVISKSFFFFSFPIPLHFLLFFPAMISIFYGIVWLDEIRYYLCLCALIFIGISGYSKEELIGSNVKILVPPGIRDRHDDLIRDHIETGKSRLVCKYFIPIAFLGNIIPSRYCTVMCHSSSSIVCTYLSPYVGPLYPRYSRLKTYLLSDKL